MSLALDLRYAVRTLLKARGFTTVAVATLALGIGATVAIFSVVRGVLLEPLPYPEPGRLVQLWQIGDRGQQMSWSEPNFRDIQAGTRSFEHLAAYQNGVVTVTGAGAAARVRSAAVSEEFFAALGVEPVRGRGLLPDDHRDGAPVVVVSHGYWRSALGGDLDAVGRTLRLNDVAHTVIGVLPERQGYPVGTDLWVPRTVRPEPSRTAHNWRAIARLAAGVDPEAAGREMSTVATRLKAVYGEDTWMVAATAVPLRDELVGSVRSALVLLLSSAGLLLLIACANVANLLLARATTRQRELAVRLALGAGRGRVLRQLLTEAAVLALTAGAVGVILAVWGVDALLAAEPGRLPRLESVGVDWLVVLFAVGVSLAAALGISLATTLRATRADVRDALSEGRRGTSSAAGRLRGTLVAAQIALTLVLLVGAGLLSRSFVRLVTLDPGYRTGGALTAEVTLPPATGASDDPLIMGSANPRAAGMLDELLTRLEALPGTGSAGAINALPLTGGGSDGLFVVLKSPDELQSLEDWERVRDEPGRSGQAEYRVATPGYFQAMDIGLREGRFFEARDAASPLHEALVSASLAEAQWPGEEAVGKLVQYGNMDGVLYPFRVVGVVDDVRDRSLAAEPQPTFYGNALQRTTMLAGGFDVVVASDRDPAALIPTVRVLVDEVTAGAPARFRTLDEVFAGSLASRRFSLLLLATFAGTALLLAALGIYGVISYTVAQRTREIGIRMALGAERSSVLRLVVREGLVLTLAGLAGGVVVAWGATRLLASQLYGVGAMDPLTFALVAGVLTAVALAASYAPARRAARTDPMDAFRNE